VSRLRVHWVGVGLLRAAVVLGFALVLGASVGGAPTPDAELSALKLIQSFSTKDIVFDFSPTC
jgi:hypothetical protein